MAEQEEEADGRIPSDRETPVGVWACAARRPLRLVTYKRTHHHSTTQWHGHFYHLQFVQLWFATWFRSRVIVR